MNAASRKAVKLVGIAGASGSGKSRLTRALHHELDCPSLILAQDYYYKDRSNIAPRERERINYDHPDALDFDLLVGHLTRLKEGGAIEHPLYDFSLHNRRKETGHAAAADVILVDGTLLYAVEACRRLFDLKVFVDTPLDLCFVRRLQRDVRERGRSADSVVAQYLATVRPMFVEFVEPTKGLADVVVRGTGDVAENMARVLARLD